MSVTVGRTHPVEAVLVPTSGLPALVPLEPTGPAAQAIAALQPGSSAMLTWADAAGGMGLEVVVRGVDQHRRPVVEALGLRRHDQRAAVRAPMTLKLGVAWIAADGPVHARYVTRNLSVGGAAVERRSSGARPLPEPSAQVAVVLALPEQVMVRTVAQVLGHHGEGRDRLTRLRFTQLRAADEAAIGVVVLNALAAHHRGAR